MAPDTTDDGPTAEAMLEQYDIEAVGTDADTDRFDWFVEKAFDATVELLLQNAVDPMSDAGIQTPEELFEELLAPDNVRDVQVIQRDLHSPKFRIWLRDCPIWANTADSTRLVNHHAEGCHAYLDVRPF